MEGNNTSITIAKLIISIVICQLFGFISAFFTMPAIEGWYSQLNKPVFNPPNWIFAPVWAILFLLMGVALFFVWKKESADGEKKGAVVIFVIQFFLNILWSFLFFGLKSPLAGLIEIIALLIMILMTIIMFYKISKTAGLLLLPYILWVTFAGVLNFAIWLIN